MRPDVSRFDRLATRGLAMLARLLPALTLATGLLGTLAAAAWAWPPWTGLIGLALVVAGAVGIKESTPCEP